jgi:hypothetical protein
VIGDKWKPIVLIILGKGMKRYTAALTILFVKFQIIWRLLFHADAIDTFRCASQ